ncbi:MAG TPA: FeoA domain-containing protein [bacterium]|nr:FeoA domain-containing protein [bacterium]
MADTLDRIPPGEMARVIRLVRRGCLSTRLIEMGILPGAVVRVVRVAPLGDPIEIRVRGTSISLRKCKAVAVEVERVAAADDGSRQHRHRHGRR